jgi:hypothetical protein
MEGWMMKQDKAVKDAKRARRFFQALVFGMPVLTIFAYVFAIVFLHGLFGAWGLNGAQLFTLQDAIVPAFLQGYVVVTILVLPICVAIFVGWFAEKQPGRIIARVACWGVVVACFLGHVLVPEENVRLLTACVAASASFVLLRDAKVWPCDALFPKAARAIICLTFVGWMSFWVVGGVDRLIKKSTDIGLVRGLALDAKDAPCAGTVLWLGEKVIVVRCSDQKGTIRVMTTKEGLHFLAV